MKRITTLALVALIAISAFSPAQAGLFDWFSKKEKSQKIEIPSDMAKQKNEECTEPNTTNNENLENKNYTRTENPRSWLKEYLIGAVIAHLLAFCIVIPLIYFKKQYLDTVDHLKLFPFLKQFGPWYSVRYKGITATTSPFSPERITDRGSNVKHPSLTYIFSPKTPKGTTQLYYDMWPSRTSAIGLDLLESLWGLS